MLSRRFVRHSPSCVNIAALGYRGHLAEGGFSF